MDAGLFPAALERAAIGLPLSDGDALRVMSGVLFLARYSPVHTRYPLEVLRHRIEPSLWLGQFHYYTDAAGVPAAFCNWAWLNGSVLADLLATGRDLEETEFQCGELPFFYELLAPFGHCRKVVRALRGMPCFQGRRIPAIRAKASGYIPAVSRVAYFAF